MPGHINFVPNFLIVVTKIPEGARSEGLLVLTVGGDVVHRGREIMAALVGGSWSHLLHSEQEVGVGCKTSNLTPCGPTSSREASHSHPR